MLYLIVNIFQISDLPFHHELHLDFSYQEKQTTSETNKSNKNPTTNITGALCASAMPFMRQCHGIAHLTMNHSHGKSSQTDVFIQYIQ